MTDQIFDVLSNIGATAYSTPNSLDDMIEQYPQYIQVCRIISKDATAALMRALSAQMIDLYTVRDYLKMPCAMEEYRAMYLYLVLCFVCADEDVPDAYLVYGQCPDTRSLLMRAMLEAIEHDIDEMNGLKENSNE